MPPCRREGSLAWILTGIACLCLMNAGPAGAARWMERLNRGAVAVDRGGGEILVSWRLLADEPQTAGFNIYRVDGETEPVRLNDAPTTGGTCWLDASPGANLASRYYVRAVVGGYEQAPSPDAVGIGTNQRWTVPLQTPNGYTPNDASVADLDGDGDYEIVLHQTGASRDPSQSGTTDPPILQAYELDGTLLWEINLGINIREGAHYTQFMVYDLDGDGRAEVACKTAPGSRDALGEFILLDGADPDADYRNQDGYILAGPEYLTVFDGLTGAALATTYYVPRRHPDTEDPTSGQLNAIWGDGYGNRVDRFLACIAYLDGELPSLVMCRGVYTRVTMAAWDWRGGELTMRWFFDSNDGNPDNLAYRGQGNHNLGVGDVDGDGRDEIVYGQCTIDDDGTGLYSTGLFDGDAMHFGDLDPSRPGLEFWGCHETNGNGETLRSAATGEIYIQNMWPGDNGRACAADLDPNYLGEELWTAGLPNLKSVNNEIVSTSKPNYINFAIWWDGDLLRELLDSNRIDKWDYVNRRQNRILTANGSSSNNGSKSTPALSADLWGDWREEVIWRASSNDELRIHTTKDPTDYRIQTLMHDPVYRLAIAWQNTVYNQPPHTGFYLGHGMTYPPAHEAIRLIGVGGAGALTRETWETLPGSTLEDLTAAIVARPPDARDELTRLSIGLSEDDAFGVRLRGYVHPPFDGDYTFWVAGDDTGELWLGGDETAASRTPIASFPGFTSFEEWDKYPEQQSAAIPLIGGQRYYIEVLWKESDFGDHLAVAWRGPGVPMGVIEDEFLSPWDQEEPGPADNGVEGWIRLGWR
jgi:rhamnogalacturonan endolyase